MKQSRNTKAKSEILKFLDESDVALSHSELQILLEGLCDRVTIYRVLDRLVEEDLIHKIVNIDGVIKYAKCHHCETVHHKHDHIHFSCTKCQEVSCLDDVKLNFVLPNHYQIQDVNFMVSGICPKCE